MSATYVSQAAVRGAVMLRDVTVVDTADGTRTPHQDIRIQGDAIISIGETGTAAREETVIDLAGRYVVPGFVDAHAHPLNRPGRAEGAYALMLANGVVGFRQMAGSARLLADRAAGRLPVFEGAPALLATCGELLTPMNAATADAARATVRAQKEQGADFIKTGMTSREPHLAALEEARRLGIPLAGHLPEDVDPREASALGMHSIEHLGPGAALFASASDESSAIREAMAGKPRLTIPSVKLPGIDAVMARIIQSLVVNPSAHTSPNDARQLALADRTFDEGRARELAREFLANETWQCPTLIRMHTQQFPDSPEHFEDPHAKYMAPRELKSWRRATEKFLQQPQATRDALHAHWEAQLRLTRIFDDEGVPLLAGTDSCGAGWVIPGFSLHDEFDLLAAAGLSPLHILQAATTAPARFFDRTDAAGTVAVGRDADLVVLDADPIEDHRNLHGIAGVLRAGGWWSRAELDIVLARVEADPHTV